MEVPCPIPWHVAPIDQLHPPRACQSSPRARGCPCEHGSTRVGLALIWTDKSLCLLTHRKEGYARELVATKKEESAYRMVDGIVKGRLENAAWFTNLDHAKWREKLIPRRRYTPEEYPTYDN